jgi:predicted GNAT family acetyltransferase
MTREVHRNEDRSRYELVEDGAVVGYADFRARGSDVVMPHTVIDPGRRGEGLGAELVRGALDDLRERGARVLPACWYVAEFIDGHPDYRDLLAA